MVISLVWVYVTYMFAPAAQPEENINWTWDAGLTWEVVTEIIPELDAENPEDTDAPILITEDWEVSELDQTISVQLENWQTEVVRLWDLNDAVQID
jgi:hypothetical protein